MSLDQFTIRAAGAVFLLICLMALINFTDLPNKMAVTSCYGPDGTAACYERKEP